MSGDEIAVDFDIPQKTLDHYSWILKENELETPAIAAVKTLHHILKETPSITTVSALTRLLEKVSDVLETSDGTPLSVGTGCKMYISFIWDSDPGLGFHEGLVKKGECFLENIANARDKIATQCHRFITDKSIVLTHGYSETVLKVLKEARLSCKQFFVYVTEAQPQQHGDNMVDRLREFNIDCSLILDCAVGYIMEKVSLVLLGAECVVETGGILSKLGSLTMSICAKAYNKPVYAAVESIKFARIFPLKQADVTNTCKYPYAFRNNARRIPRTDSRRSNRGITNSPSSTGMLNSVEEECTLEIDPETVQGRAVADLISIGSVRTRLSSTAVNDAIARYDEDHPTRDYTPPQYVTLLFTDLGILPPTAICDELMNLYN